MKRERLAWFLVLLLSSSVVLGGGYQATNVQNGDVNGDGTIGIADAIDLLSFLFINGPEPVEARVTIQATGQLACYGAATFPAPNTIPCNSVVFPGQDAVFQAGFSQAGRFFGLSCM